MESHTPFSTGVCRNNFRNPRNGNKYSVEFVVCKEDRYAPGLQHLKVNKDVKPVVMSDRRIPLAERPKLRDELDRMISLGVVMPVDDPTPWVIQMVLVETK